MKALFNGVCSICNAFKPRCATVYFRRLMGDARTYTAEPRVLCEECRKSQCGTFKLDAKHK
jgi:hypothetical protein